MRFLPILLLSVFLAVPVFAQDPLFSGELPAGFADKNDLWVVKLDPTTLEKEGGLYVVQQRFLGRYAGARDAGYPWSWAPLSKVLVRLNAPDVGPADPALPRENQRLKDRMRAAVEILSIELSNTSKP